VSVGVVFYVKTKTVLELDGGNKIGPSGELNTAVPILGFLF
jgi:hypothetical protein